MSMDADVVVVGFGPTGAALAGLLAQQGLSVLVVEKSRHVFPQPRAAHVDHTGLRTFQELGCLDAVLPPMIRNLSLDLVNSAHELLVRVPAGQKSVSSLPTSVYFYQPDLDRTLRAAVTAMPSVTVRLGSEMTRINQDAEGVTLKTSENGASQTYSARWAVACDGARSPVREALGIGLQSLDFEERWLVIDVKLLTVPPGLPRDRVVQVCDPRRPHLTTPISQDRQRFEVMLLPSDDLDQAEKPEFVARQLAPWIAPEEYLAERSAIYTFHGLLADSWRRGRILLAGDAAHQMPPFLGQGMCSGLRDASNLAWKLAAVQRSGVDPVILDSYGSERSPHVRTIIEAAIEFGRLVCVTDPKAAEERDSRLLSPQGRRIEGATFALPRFGPGPLVLQGGGSLFIQPLISGQRLDDLVGPRFLLVVRDRDALGASMAMWKKEIDPLVMLLSERPNAELLGWLDRFKTNVVVVRPDRYVLGTGQSLDEISIPQCLLEPRRSRDQQSAAVQGAGEFGA